MDTNGNRAFLYLRLSRALGDADDPDLLASHRAALLRQAAAEGIAVPPENQIEEIGSGDSIDQRPRFRALLEAWERAPGQGGILYCVALDRLSRGSFAEVGRIVEALAAAGIEVRTPGRRYDLTQPDDELFYAFSALLARHELGRYRQRARLQRDERTRAGGIVSGGDRFGYRWDKNEEALIAVPEELRIVTALFRDSLTLSAVRLRDKYGLPAPTILRILHNPVYTGWPARHVERHRWRGGAGKSGGRWLPPERWLWPERPGTYPAAVSREEFMVVQAVLAARRREGAKTGTTAGWCRDLVEFEGREGARIELGSHREGGGAYLTYTTRHCDGRRCYVSRETVHRAALTRLRSVFERPEVLRAALAQEQVRTATGSPFSLDEQQAAADELTSLRRQYDELLRREIRAADAEEAASLARVRVEITREIGALKQRLEPAPAPQSVAAAALAPWLTGVPCAFDAEWEAMADPERRKLANAVLRAVRIRVTPERRPLPWRREVVAVPYQPWLALLIEE